MAIAAQVSDVSNSLLVKKGACAKINFAHILDLAFYKKYGYVQFLVYPESAKMIKKIKLKY